VRNSEPLHFHSSEIDEIIMCANSLMIIEEEDESTDVGNLLPVISMI